MGNSGETVVNRGQTDENRWSVSQTSLTAELQRIMAEIGGLKDHPITDVPELRKLGSIAWCTPTC